MACVIEQEWYNKERKIEQRARKWEYARVMLKQTWERRERRPIEIRESFLLGDMYIYIYTLLFVVVLSDFFKECFDK